MKHVFFNHPNRLMQIFSKNSIIAALNPNVKVNKNLEIYMYIDLFVSYDIDIIMHFVISDPAKIDHSCYGDGI